MEHSVETRGCGSRVWAGKGTIPLVALVLLVCQIADTSAQDTTHVYDQFIIGVWQPGGWSAYGQRDISLTSGYHLPGV